MSVPVDLEICCEGIVIPSNTIESLRKFNVSNAIMDYIGGENMLLSEVGHPKHISQLIEEVSEKLLRVDVNKTFFMAYGPHKSLAMAKIALCQVCSYAFPIRIGKKRVGIKKRGIKKELCCAVKNCTFSLFYELVVTDEGLQWFVETFNNQHIVHKMDITPGQILSNPLNRGIPENFISFG